MALLHRIFSSKRKSRNLSKERNNTFQKDVQPNLDKSKIRLVICADTERGRTPYFDSNAIRLVEKSGKNDFTTLPKTLRTKSLFSSGHRESSISPHRQTPKYHFQKLGSDVKVLEEMMFGTAAMAFKGLTVKVHLLRSPPRLMVSNVFNPEKPNIDGSIDIEPDYNSLSGFTSDVSSGEYGSPIAMSQENNVRSIPVDVPPRELWSDHSTDDDSGLAYFSSSGSLRTSLPSPSNSSISSYSSLHRRWMRAQTTSLNGYHRRDSGLPFESSLTRPQRNKLAVGIIFGSYDEKDECTELFQSFFFSHFALIEGHVDKLRCVVEKAFFNSTNFLPAVMEALDTFRSDICDLYMAPRLLEPVWLTMVSATTYKTVLFERFMEKFMWLVTNYNTKSCKFFVSTLLSAVLTHHLAWVATVTPADGTHSNTYLDKHTAQWVDTLTKSHPYNPLWAQLGDLLGAIGCPRKISRTIVVGKKANIVKRLLCVLSYFIRCSEVQENTDLQCLNNIVNDIQFESSLSQSPSVKTLTDGQEESPTTTKYGAALARQTDNSFTNHKASKGKSQSSETSLGDKQAEDDSHSSLKCCSKSVTSHQTESTMNNQNHGHLGRHGSSYNGANLEDSCEQDQEVANSKCINNNDLVEICQYDKINPVPNKIFYKNEKSIPLNNDTSVLPLHSVHNNKVDNLTNNSYSSIKSLNQSNSSIFTAAEPMGMSELYIYAPNFSQCSLTSAKLLTPQIEQTCLVSRETPHTDHASKDVVQAEAEQFSKLQSLSASKPKSRLTQQLGEAKITGSNDNDKLLTSTVGSPVLFQAESRNEIDSKGRLHLPKQTSQDSRTSAERPSMLARKRSTSTEFNRRRHKSSTGSIDYEPFDPSIHCMELRIPDSLSESGQWHVQAFDRNFGHSLMADYTDHYMSDFVLLGTSDTNCKPRLLNDLQMSVRHSALDEPIDEAVSVIADTDNWTVEVASSKVMGISPSGCTPWTSSKLVANLIASVVEIFKLKMSAEFCLMHLEDKLQEIYFKGVMLSEKMRTSTTYSQQELTDILGCDSSDMPLLLAVAGTHMPSLVRAAQ